MRADIDRLVELVEWAEHSDKLMKDSAEELVSLGRARTLLRVSRQLGALVWNQGTWATHLGAEPVSIDNACGSYGCIAGKQVVDQGWFVVGAEASPPKEVNGKLVIDRTQRRTVSSLASESLGLTKSQSNALFGMDNRLRDLKLVVNEIAKGQGDPEPFTVFDEDE